MLPVDDELVEAIARKLADLRTPLEVKPIIRATLIEYQRLIEERSTMDYGNGEEDEE